LLSWGIVEESVVVTGAPAMDRLLNQPLLSLEDLESDLGVHLKPPLVLATYHPVTARSTAAHDEIREVINGLERWSASAEATVVWTRPNRDVGGLVIETELAKACADRSNWFMMADLGVQRYWSLMSYSALVFGNSSSGIIEAPAFNVPTVNIGERQGGRLRVHRVVDCPCRAEAIGAAVSGAAEVSSTQRLAVPNPYGDGRAVQRMCSYLNSWFSQ
jgi:UDP-hydrolysing UDP-N-acetyl-D-glucosamine 2-epimerase